MVKTEIIFNGWFKSYVCCNRPNAWLPIRHSLLVELPGHWRIYHSLYPKGHEQSKCHLPADMLFPSEPEPEGLSTTAGSCKTKALFSETDKRGHQHQISSCYTHELSRYATIIHSHNILTPPSVHSPYTQTAIPNIAVLPEHHQNDLKKVILYSKSNRCVYCSVGIHGKHFQKTEITVVFIS